jgi:hypothetical protein
LSDVDGGYARDLGEGCVSQGVAANVHTLEGVPVAGDDLVVKLRELGVAQTFLEGVDTNGDQMGVRRKHGKGGREGETTDAVRVGGATGSKGLADSAFDGGSEMGVRDPRLVVGDGTGSGPPVEDIVAPVEGSLSLVRVVPPPV